MCVAKSNRTQPDTEHRIQTASELPQCYPEDNACLQRTITGIIRKYPNGMAGLNIPPLDPLRINAIDIAQGAQSPIAIKLQLRDQQLFGISKGSIDDVE